MKSLFQAHNGYDWVTIAARLKSTGHLDDIGGEAAIADLVNATPTSYGAPEYAAIIYRHSISRQVIRETLAITEAAYQDVVSRPGETLVSEAIDRLASIDACKNISSGPQPIAAGADKLLEKMQTIQELGTVAGLSTGLKSLDHILGGLQKNKLHLLAGRPGMGKSGLALQIALNVAKRGSTVLFFALEMSDDDMTARLASSICGVPYETFNRPDVPNMGDVITAIDQVSNLPIIFDTTPGLKVSNIRSISQKAMIKYPIDLIIVDHGSLVRPEKFTGKDTQDQSQVAIAMQALSKQLGGVPVLCLLQLSRAVENSNDKRPKMHHLRNSGEWEQNADSIMFLYRDEVYNPDTEFPGLGEIGTAKNRGGKTGNLQIAANVALNRFVDLEVRTAGL
jgi:replicative DNA helicase